MPRTSQKRIWPVRRWVRRSKLTRTTLPRGRAAFEGAEHVRHTVIHWNSHTTTIFLGYRMFQFATTPDGTNASPQTRAQQASAKGFS